MPAVARQQLTRIDEYPTDEIARRRTFAIIFAPGGRQDHLDREIVAVWRGELAGEVKARGDRRRARSDWMAIERERGISVSSAVMSFEHQGLAFNLLDTTSWTRRATRISARTPTAP